MSMADPLWFSMFLDGQIVERRNRPDGSEPPYRFQGPVCGSYRNPVTGEPGAVVMSFKERGCLQLFPDRFLEEVTGGDDG